MDEDSYDLAVDGDRFFTCLVHSNHKYHLSCGQVDAEIHKDESSKIMKRSVTINNNIAMHHLCKV